MDFNLGEAILVANQVVNNKFNRNLTDIEIIIITGVQKLSRYYPRANFD